MEKETGIHFENGSLPPVDADASIASTAVAIRTEIYRRMPPAEKLQQAITLYRMAQQLKAAGVRMLHPDWTSEQVEEEVKHIFLHASG